MKKHVWVFYFALCTDHHCAFHVVSDQRADLPYLITNSARTANYTDFPLAFSLFMKVNFFAREMRDRQENNRIQRNETQLMGFLRPKTDIKVVLRFDV